MPYIMWEYNLKCQLILLDVDVMVYGSDSYKW